MTPWEVVWSFWGLRRPKSPLRVIWGLGAPLPRPRMDQCVVFVISHGCFLVVFHYGDTTHLYQLTSSLLQHNNCSGCCCYWSLPLPSWSEVGPLLQQVCGRYKSYGTPRGVKCTCKSTSMITLLVKTNITIFQFSCELCISLPFAHFSLYNSSDSPSS